MKIYLLIHEQDTDAIWGSDVKPFTDKQDAHNTMYEDWKATAESWEYDSKRHKDEDECECCEDTAVIRDGNDMEHWRIEEHEVDVWKVLSEMNSVESVWRYRVEMICEIGHAVKSLMDDNADNLVDTTDMYAQGYHDALVDIMDKFNIPHNEKHFD